MRRTWDVRVGDFVMHAWDEVETRQPGQVEVTTTKALASLGEFMDWGTFQGVFTVRDLFFEAQLAPVKARIRERFDELVGRWRTDIAYVSSFQTIVMHPAYQRIIGMGPDVLPLIFRELRDNPAPWFWALAAITGDDPAEGIPEFEDARRAWLRWGEARGFVALP